MVSVLDDRQSLSKMEVLVLVIPIGLFLHLGCFANLGGLLLDRSRSSEGFLLSIDQCFSVFGHLL
jgi:hypothetical protein